MIKRLLAMMLALAMLLCAAPLAALATEMDPAQTEEIGEERWTGVPPTIDHRITVSGKNGDCCEVYSEGSLDNFGPQAPADVDTVEEKVDWIAQQCRAQGFTDEWDIALWLHDWLIYHADYDQTYTYYHPNGVLLMGVGVCQSYAEAYELLLDEFGIENQLLLANEMNHAWNLVKINGQWCHVDCTWDDPIGYGSEDYENHFYFGVNDAMMRQTHTWNAGRYPACTTLDNSYIVRNGAYVVDSKQSAEQAFVQIAEARIEDFVCCYVGDDPDFNLYQVLSDWLQEYGWKYGVRMQYGVIDTWIIEIELYYSEPWEKPEDFEDTHTHSFFAEVVEPTCGEDGYTIYTCSCGESYTADSVPATGLHSYDDHKDAQCNICGKTRSIIPGVVPVYRLYNPYTYEHLLTGGEQEKTALLAAGWSLDGVAWNAPETGIPVYRLYNPYDDWHTYTTSEQERDAMVAAGWTVDGVVSRSAAKENGRPIYRLFNPYVQTNFHLFTAGIDERDMLVQAGWILEGIAWYAVN